jgi:peptidoglycan/xylan/chitin deacetylase (PgdA/CDA1 family)
VPATFFLTGTWARSFPGRAAAIGNRYAVGNHTFNHPDLTELARRAIRRQLGRAHRAIVNRAGADPHPLFRYPFGAGDQRTLTIVKDLGYGSVRWTIDTLGWKGAGAGITKKGIVKRVTSGLRPGTIVLMHVGSAPDESMLDAAALPTVIRRIRDAGYRFVRLDRVVARLTKDQS